MQSEFETWYVMRSGWGPKSPDETYKLAEYALARNAWNAALDAAKAKMPDVIVSSRLDARGEGWNRAISTMDERLDSLKEPTR